MRKHLYVLIAVLLISSQTLTAHADPAQWRWLFGVYGDIQEARGTVGSCGTNPAANDGYDAMDGMWEYGPSNIHLGVYHSNETDNWTGLPGFYCDDIAAPMMLIPGLSKTWTIYVWADPSLPDTSAHMALCWNYQDFNGPDWFTLPPEFRFSMTLKFKPEGVVGGPAVGTTWNLSQPDSYVVQLPVFRTDNGLEGYVFDFTATVVPEPASLLALCAGLIPLAFRRRRR